jgi:hypothetical protein
MAPFGEVISEILEKESKGDFGQGSKVLGSGSERAFGFLDDTSPKTRV